MTFILPETGKDQGHPLFVTVHEIKNNQGSIRVAIYDSAKTFMKTIWKGKKTHAKVGAVEVSFENVVPGTYAIGVFHDANDNGKFDSNLLGIPKEGFGFSNDAMGTFGPPSFHEAKFDWDGQKTISIKLKYF